MRQYSSNPYSGYGMSLGGYDAQVAALAEESERTAFIRRTYLHLAAAVAAFITLELAIFTLTPDEVLTQLTRFLFGGRWTWLLVVGGFMAVSWVAHSWASSGGSVAKQYAGLGLYITAQAALFTPLLYVAQLMEARAMGESHIILTAGVLTGLIFGGLTLMAFLTRADFSWMGRYLVLAGLGGFGLVLCGAIFGFSWGLLGMGFFILLAAGYILYDTSNVIHHFRTDQHVAASLALFASVALLFWYVLQFVMSLSNRE